jgi:hypothetical protein
MPRWLHHHLKYFYYLRFNAYNKANLFFGVLSQFCQHYCSHNGGKYLLPPKKYLSQCMARTKMPTCQKIPILRNAENKKKNLETDKRQNQEPDDIGGEREGVLFLVGHSAKTKQAAPLSPGTRGGRSTNAPPFHHLLPLSPRR